MSRSRVLAGVLLVLLCAVAYYPALMADFVWDDNSVTENSLMSGATGLTRIWTTPSENVNEEHYWPVVYTAFWLQHQLWGLNPFGYHLVNILLHAANAILVWLILARARIRGAWFAAAIFAVHPVHVESVAWVIELKDVLSALFYLSAFLIWLGWLESRTAWRLTLSISLFGLGMLTKSMIVTLPAAMLIYLWYTGSVKWRGGVLSVVPYFLLGLAFVVLDFLVMRDAGIKPPVIPLLGRIAVAGQALWFYAGKLIFPVGLVNIYPRWDPLDLPSLKALMLLAAVLVMLALFSVRRRSGRGAFAAAAYYIVTLSPVLGFVSFTYMDHSFVADRFQYLASIGPIALFAGAITNAAERGGLRLRRELVYGAAAVLLTFLAAQSIRYASRFTNSFTLLEHTLAHNPRSWLAHYNLALAYSGTGPHGIAEQHFRSAIALRPADTRPYMGLAVLLLRTGRPEEALEMLNGALWLKPRDAELLYDAGMAYAALKKLDKAEQCFRGALQSDPGLVSARIGYGVILALDNRRDEARRQFSEALRLEPHNAAARRNLDALTTPTTESRQ